MEFFYQSGAMGYHGEGWKWHKWCDCQFPDLPIITKTITLKPKKGLPFAVLKFGKTVWNKNMWSNMGFHDWFWQWIDKHNQNPLIVSLGGTDGEIQFMCNALAHQYNMIGIELNFSCPNVKTNNKLIPRTDFPLYLKLNHTQDPYKYDLRRIKRIHINSVPKFWGGISGGMAKKYNWPYIKKLIDDGLDVAGCSFVNKVDLYQLKKMGCKYTGIGSIMLTDPYLVENIEGVF